MKRKNILLSLALGTALTALPLVCDAHTMTEEDIAFVLREWNNGAAAILRPGDRMEGAVAPFGGDIAITDEKVDFLRMVTYRLSDNTLSVVALTGKDDNRPADDLGVSAASILSRYIFMKTTGFSVGTPYKDFEAKFGKADLITGHSNFNWGVNDFPDHGPYYESYYYTIGGREFFITTDNRKPEHPIVQMGFRTEV